MDFHILTSLGAGCFVLAFIKGMSGKLRDSIWLAVVASLMGTVAAIDGGALQRPGLEPAVVIAANVVLPFLAVLVSRRFYLSEQRTRA